MARDYKHTLKSKSHQEGARGNRAVSRWRWLMAAVAALAFGGFLTYLKLNAAKHPADPPPAAQAPAAPPAQPAKKPAPAQPSFEFYTVLPNKESVLPDHELDTRLREERVGKAKHGKYIMHAGSFKSFDDADRLKAKLALMGIESKVEKTRQDGGGWYRVKIGPYSQMASVDLTKRRLEDKGIKAIVLEAVGKPKTAAPKAGGDR